MRAPTQEASDPQASAVRDDEGSDLDSRGEVLRSEQLPGFYPNHFVKIRIEIKVSIFLQ